MVKPKNGRNWWRRLGRRGRKAVEGYVRLGGAAAGGRMRRKGPSPEAVRRVGLFIRSHRIARESRLAYAELARRIERHGPGITAEQVDDQMPERLVLFIGYPRSGHSLVGSLLDAHPDSAIANELNALRLLRKGASYPETVRAIKYNAFLFGYFGRTNTGYSYGVPGQHQGRYRQLRVAGDKKGNRTTRLLRRYPRLEETLVQGLPVPVHFVHVIRHPLDNIATKALRTGVSLRQSARSYFSNAAFVDSFRDRHSQRLTEIHLEDLTARPEETLGGLLDDLGLPRDRAYLAACAGVVADRPSESRHRVVWDARLREEILRRSRDYEFLARYGGSA